MTFFLLGLLSGVTYGAILGGINVLKGNSTQKVPVLVQTPLQSELFKTTLDLFVFFSLGRNWEETNNVNRIAYYSRYYVILWVISSKSSTKFVHL